MFNFTKEILNKWKTRSLNFLKDGDLTNCIKKYISIPWHIPFPLMMFSRETCEI